MQVKQSKDTCSIYLASSVPSVVTSQIEDKAVPVIQDKDLKAYGK
jgi:hypothetical protein